MKYEQQTMAKANLRDGAISFKTSIMIADTIRGMMSDKAQALLERVMNKQQPIQFTRFRDGAGHRSGFGAAKYPVKAAQAFLALVKQGVANAENKGLGVPLKISSVIANEASRPMHQGTARGHLMKRTHVEIILTETDESKKHEKKAKPKPQVKPAAKPTNSNPTVSAESKPAAKTESKPAKETQPAKPASQKESTTSPSQTQSPKAKPEASEAQ